MTTNRLTNQQLDAIETRRAKLNTLGLPGGTWTASPRDEKSVTPPELAQVVEDVLSTGAAKLRSSVGVFGDEAHAEFVAHAPGDVDALLAEIRRLRAELAETQTKTLATEADEIVAHCPDHGSRDGVWMDCHCAVADDLRRRAAARPSA